MSTLSRTIKQSVYKVASWEPSLRYLRGRKLRSRIVVLMYHELAEDDDEIEAWTVVKRSDFVRQMEYLNDNFRIVSLKDAFEWMNNSSPSEKPMAVITFDDGYAGNKRILLPIVKSMNIPVTIFVSTKAVQEQSLYWYDRLISAVQGKRVIEIDLSHLSLENYKINSSQGADNWCEIERLLSDLKTLDPDTREKAVSELVSDLKTTQCSQLYHMFPLSLNDVSQLSGCPLVSIGAHSHCHNILTQLKEDEARMSVRMSKELLESWISRKVNYFSYPNGNYDDVILNILREEGFICGLTTASSYWERGKSLFLIPRIGIGRYDSIELFKFKTAGGWCDIHS